MRLSSLLIAVLLVAAGTSLSAQSYTVTSPNGGETLTVGQMVTITWTSAGSPGNLDIDLSVDSGANYTVNLATNTADDGTETVVVPNNPGALCRIRVRDNPGATVLDESNADFTIVTPSITVTAPNGAENWTVGGNQNVTWNSVGSFGTVDIQLSTNSGGAYTVDLQLATANDGTQSITVPNNPTTTARVRVRDTTTGTILDESDADFTITAAPTITVTSPNGGETWVIGAADTVTWNSTGTPGNVDIQLSLNSGGSYTVDLQLNTADDGTQGITVPNNPTTTARVRVRDTTTGLILDESNADFTIANPSITVTAPNGGENWSVGGNQNVTWTSVGVPGTVDIHLSTDGGGSFPISLAAATANDGTQSIVVPNNPSVQCRVRVRDTATGLILDTSNANFTITTAPTITVTAPNGGENISVGANLNVTWTSGGSPGNVDIHLSTDGGGTFPIVLILNTADDGAQSVVVPNNPSVQCRVRVRDNATQAIFDVSDANFTIAVAAPAAVTMSVGPGNPGSQSVSPGSSATALVFRLTETGGGSTYTVTSVSADITVLHPTPGVAIATIQSVSLRRGSNTLGSIVNGGAGWGVAGSVITVNFNALSSAITAGTSADFRLVISFTGGTPPSPNPGFQAGVTSGDVNSGASVSGGPVNGGTISLREDLPDDPFAEDKDDSCQLTARGGPAWPLALLVLLAGFAALTRRRRGTE
ncbi:MAG: hypothetical protein IT464_03650 [Planctomycetes bacterium]|nr:hypothetical protein [Planctomycetota bacterium]